MNNPVIYSGDEKSWTSSESFQIRDPKFEVSFAENDPENPQNWPSWYKAYVVGTVALSTTGVILYSTAYTNGLPGIESTFDISSRTIALLGLTTYLFGLGCGCVVVAPLGEMYGRRPIYLITTAIYALLVLPVAMAPSFEAILVCRFLGGFFGSAPVASAPTVSDVVSAKHRALAFSFWGLGTINAPVIGPIIGGFVYQNLGWRWINWVVFIWACAAFTALFFVRETYTPAILRARRQRLEKVTGDSRWWTRYDRGQLSPFGFMKSNLARPFRMAVSEPICIFWNIYIGVINAVLFLCFVGYPIVFSQMRGWSPGVAGLGYCGIGIGTTLAVCFEPLCRKLIERHRDGTGYLCPEASISPVCIGSILIPIGEAWFSWTARPSIHWICPIIAGVSFGLGNGLVFIYATNYIAGSYADYAASALAGNAVTRYVSAAVLPLAGVQLYNALGVAWTGTMLAAVEVVLIPIPFFFYRYGWKIRQRSKLIGTVAG